MEMLVVLDVLQDRHLGAFKIRDYCLNRSICRDNKDQMAIIFHGTKGRPGFNVLSVVEQDFYQGHMECIISAPNCGSVILLTA